MALSLSLVSHQVLPLRLPKLSRIFSCLLVPHFASSWGSEELLLVSLPRVRPPSATTMLAGFLNHSLLKSFPFHHHPFQERAPVPHARLPAPPCPPPAPPRPLSRTPTADTCSHNGWLAAPWKHRGPLQLPAFPLTVLSGCDTHPTPSAS